MQTYEEALDQYIDEYFDGIYPTQEEVESGILEGFDELWKDANRLALDTVEEYDEACDAAGTFFHDSDEFARAFPHHTDEEWDEFIDTWCEDNPELLRYIDAKGYKSEALRNEAEIPF